MANYSRLTIQSMVKVGSKMARNHPLITLNEVSKRFDTSKGNSQIVFEQLTFCQQREEIVSILGPNGAGKTTIIRILAGLEPIDSGEVLIYGEPPSSRAITQAIVPQEYDLFQWQTVQQAIDFGLKCRGVPAVERRERVAEFIDLTCLNGHENKYPHELSGGLKQRTAIARALVLNPDLLMLDEPFRALDSRVRRELHDLLLSLWSTKSPGILLVTHDTEEAVFLSDRIICLSRAPARIVLDLPVELDRPRRSTTRFEKRFLDVVAELEATLDYIGENDA